MGVVAASWGLTGNQLQRSQSIARRAASGEKERKLSSTGANAKKERKNRSANGERDAIVPLSLPLSLAAQ